MGLFSILTKFSGLRRPTAPDVYTPSLDYKPMQRLYGVELNRHIVELHNEFTKLHNEIQPDIKTRLKPANGDMLSSLDNAHEYERLKDKYEDVKREWGNSVLKPDKLAAEWSWYDQMRSEQEGILGRCRGGFREWSPGVEGSLGKGRKIKRDVGTGEEN